MGSISQFVPQRENTPCQYWLASLIVAVGIFSMERQSERIIFFDGVCGLCNRFVDFILKRDCQHIFSFSPLQGETARRLLPHESLAISTIIFLKHGKVLQKSEACFDILCHLGGLWKLVLIFKIIPNILRDYLYDFISNHRYSWFGKRKICRLPTAEEKRFFLD